VFTGCRDYKKLYGTRVFPDRNGTICACDTNLCNGESMGEKFGGTEVSSEHKASNTTNKTETTCPSSDLQTSDSRSLIVICVLAVSALITFSENYDVNISTFD